MNLSKNLSIKSNIANIYSFLFARMIFQPLHKVLIILGWKGMGISNYHNSFINGEDYFIDFFSKVYKEEPIVFDVGAHIGDYTKKILNKIPNARIYAFEPNPSTFNILKRRIKNKNFLPVNLGIGRKNYNTKIYDYSLGKGSLHASIYRGVFQDIYNKKATAIRVKIVSLDHFCKKNKINHINLLKLDIEGGEYEALKGAKKLIQNKKIDIIQFEFNTMNILSKVFFIDFWKMLKNYKIYRMLPKELLKIKKYDASFCEIYAYQNFVAVRKDLKNEST